MATSHSIYHNNYYAIPYTGIYIIHKQAHDALSFLTFNSQVDMCSYILLVIETINCNYRYHFG